MITALIIESLALLTLTLAFLFAGKVVEGIRQDSLKVQTQLAQKVHEVEQLQAELTALRALPAKPSPVNRPLPRQRGWTAGRQAAELKSEMESI